MPAGASCPGQEALKNRRSSRRCTWPRAAGSLCAPISPAARAWLDPLTWSGNGLAWTLPAALALVALLLAWLMVKNRSKASAMMPDAARLDSDAPIAIVTVAADGRILEASVQLSLWTGLDGASLRGRALDTLFVEPPAGDGPAMLRGIRGVRPVYVVSDPAPVAEEAHGHRLLWLIDRQAGIESAATHRLEDAFSEFAEGVLLLDAEGRIVATNAAHDRLTGFAPGSRLGGSLQDTRRLPDGRSLSTAVWPQVERSGRWRGELSSRRADGSSYREHMTIRRLEDGRLLAVFSAWETQQLVSMPDVREGDDPLTGLAGRATFERHAAGAIVAADAGRRMLAVLFIGLDAFRAINEGYGRAVGDEVLARLAARLRQALSAGSVAARVGGDEFAVLIEGLDALEQVRPLAQRLLATVAEPLWIEAGELSMSASIGVAGYPLDGADIATLMAHAEAAMAQAKREERNAVRFHAPVAGAAARRQRVLATELRRALRRDEFQLVYQPSVDLRHGRIGAAEALLRWRHPERGEVLPGEFIPQAERTGLIREIDAWVLERACRQLRAWIDAGLPALRMAVNVSARSLAHPQFLAGLRENLTAHRVPAGRLLLEITEGAILRLGEDVRRTLHTLHELGVGVAIDDFGTGYSSLSYLKLPAIVGVKVDRSFVAGLPDSASDAAIVEAILALAARLGLYTIAEGIEHEAQHAFLLRAGCAEGQGYLYARAVSPDAFERWLRRPGEAPFRLHRVSPGR